ncbi:MAG: ABC transporter permease [Acidimicrobiia bacterium]
MTRVLRVEWWKLRRSRVSLATTLLLALLVPGMGLGFYVVAVSGGTGAMAIKASALLRGDGWAGYLGLVDQIAAVAIFIGAGVVVAWVFGREHADRTFQALFALPVSRSTIAAAKFVILAGWLAVLAIAIPVMALGLGVIAGVGSDGGGDALVAELIRLLAICSGAGLLALPTGYVASVGRGYLPAIGALIITVAAAQIAVLFGTGGWFPFAVPGLAAVTGTPGAPALSLAQVVLVPLVSLAGMAGTVRWWRRAEVV